MQRKILKQGKIEPATPEDLEEILAIENESSSNPWKRPFFEHEFSGRFSTILVYRDAYNMKISGFIIFRKIEETIEINNIAVKVQKRGEGIGSALISRVINIGLKENAAEIFLEVRSQNLSALKLYKRSGFKPAGKRVGYYSNPKDDALVYKLELG